MIDVASNRNRSLKADNKTAALALETKVEALAAEELMALYIDCVMIMYESPTPTKVWGCQEDGDDDTGKHDQ